MSSRTFGGFVGDEGFNLSELRQLVLRLLTDERRFGKGDDATGVFPSQAVPQYRVKIPAGFKGADSIKSIRNQ